MKIHLLCVDNKLDSLNMGKCTALYMYDTMCIVHFTYLEYTFRVNGSVSAVLFLLL